jgi:hypothetical protein
MGNVKLNVSASHATPFISIKLFGVASSVSEVPKRYDITTCQKFVMSLRELAAMRVADIV